MKEDACILCGQTFPAGLHIMGCLICFPCEKRMLWNELSLPRRRGLCCLYDGSQEHLETRVIACCDTAKNSS